MRFYVFCTVVVACTLSASAVQFRSSFEEGADDAPAGWELQDDGMSTVSEMKARTGKRGLRIADADRDELGSSAFSEAINVNPGQDVRLSAWCFLESGDRKGLGLYIEFLDKEGKRIGERKGYRQTLIQNQWNLVIASRRPPVEAVKVRAWLHTITDAVITCHIDDVVLETVPQEGPVSVVGWEGAVLDPNIRKAWPAGVRWEHGRSTDVDLVFDEPQDWTKYRGFTLNVYCERPTNSSFMLILSSENPNTDGPDYFRWQLPTNFRGWRQLALPFNNMNVSRQPAGFGQIESIKLRATGFSQKMNPNTVIVLDGFNLVR